MNDSVKRILESTQYMTLATVAEDGSPQNVPVRFAYDDEHLYFRSPVGTRHGLNIERDGRIAAAVVDMSQSVKGAVYIQSRAEKLEGEREARGVAVFNSRFTAPPNQWDTTIYFEITIGELDEAHSVGEMYYFQSKHIV